MAEIVKKIGRITKYETTPYVGSASILDLDRSTSMPTADVLADVSIESDTEDIAPHERRPTERDLVLPPADDSTSGNRPAIRRRDTVPHPMTGLPADAIVMTSDDGEDEGMTREFHSLRVPPEVQEALRDLVGDLDDDPAADSKPPAPPRPADGSRRP
jgi:hypothetical protein